MCLYLPVVGGVAVVYSAVTCDCTAGLGAEWSEPEGEVLEVPCPCEAVVPFGIEGGYFE